MLGLFLGHTLFTYFIHYKMYRWRDSNSHSEELVPKTSVSTNFTTSASIGTANIDRKITLREKMIGWLEKLTLLKILTHGKF